MGYFSIIDSLSNNRVEEGMIDSISKNSSKGDSDKLLKALLNCDIRTIPSKNIKSNMSFYNKSPFDDIDTIIKYSRLPVVNRRNYYIYHLIKNNTHYIMVCASSRNPLSGLSRCFIYEAQDEGVVDYIWDLVDRNKLTLDIEDLSSGLKGCKTVADTYRVFGSTLLSNVYGIQDDMQILKNTDEVLEALFNSSVGLIKSDYSDFKYKPDMVDIANSCVDYRIKLEDYVFSIMFDFSDTESYKKSYISLKDNIRSNSNYYSIYKMGTKQIVLEFYI